MSNPVGGGQSGRYLVEIFERLGIADAVKAKVVYGPGGPAGLIGHFLARGDVDVGLQQMAELRAVPDIQVVGPLPPDIQRETVFSAGLSHAAVQPDGGTTLIRALRGRAAAAIIAAKGFTAAHAG
jgi:molybdate transport system substrate-binding protein